MCQANERRHVAYQAVLADATKEHRQPAIAWRHYSTVRAEEGAGDKVTRLVFNQEVDGRSTKS